MKVEGFDNRKITKSFAPGSEWVYFKIYSSPKASDKMLAQLIRPYISAAFGQNLADQWFFIRYNDPHYHLRLRIHSPDNANYHEVVSLFKDHSDPFLSNGLIHNIQFDTYHREIERYGPGTMEYSEKVFFYDSEMCVELIEVLRGDEKEEARWLTSLQATNALLDDFKYRQTEKLELLRKMSKRFGDEFHKNADLARQISRKYRDHRQKIDTVIFGEDDSVMGKYARTVIRKRSVMIEPLASRIVLYLEKEKKVLLDDLLGSYIHMMMNRMFRTRQRLMEMVLYDFLFRTYKSAMAKNHYQNSC